MTTKIEYALGDILKHVDIDTWAMVIKIEHNGYRIKYLHTDKETFCQFSVAHNFYKRARA